jgi:hypothetical protein
MKHAFKEWAIGGALVGAGAVIMTLLLYLHAVGVLHR